METPFGWEAAGIRWWRGQVWFGRTYTHIYLLLQQMYDHDNGWHERNEAAEVFGVGLAWSWFGQRKEPDGIGGSQNFAEGAWHKGPC